MNVFLRLFLVLTVAVLTIIFPACSSDDDGTNSTIKVPGSTLDLDYSTFRNIALSLTDLSNSNRIQDLLDLYQRVVAHKSANSAERVAQIPEYHADSRYWYFEHTDTTYAGIEIGHDSIQFLHSGEAVQSPDSALLTEIKGGTWWVRIDTTTAKRGDHLAPGDTLFTIHLTFDMTGEQGAIAAAGDVVITVNAQSSGLPPGYYTQCDWDCDLAATGDSIALNLTDDRCPKSGEIWYAGFHAMTCPLPEPSFSGTWDARGTFSDGVLTWYIENEVYYWESEGYCFWHFEY